MAIFPSYAFFVRFMLTIILKPSDYARTRTCTIRGRLKVSRSPIPWIPTVHRLGTILLYGWLVLAKSKKRSGEIPSVSNQVRSDQPRSGKLDWLFKFFLRLSRYFIAVMLFRFAHKVEASPGVVNMVDVSHLLALILSAQNKLEEALNMVTLTLINYPDNLNLLITKVMLERQVHGGHSALLTCKEVRFSATVFLDFLWSNIVEVIWILYLLNLFHNIRIEWWIRLCKLWWIFRCYCPCWRSWAQVHLKKCWIKHTSHTLISGLQVKTSDYL